MSPPTRQFFGDFGSFVSHVIILAFRKFWFARNYLCPPMGYLLSPPTRQFFGDCRKFWFAHNYLCPPMGYLLSPPTCPSNSAIFWRFSEVLLRAYFFVPFVSGYLLSPPTRPSNLAIFGDFRKFCFARNYLCSPILWSHLCSSCCSSSMCLLFYP